MRFSRYEPKKRFILYDSWFTIHEVISVGVGGFSEECLNKTEHLKSEKFF